MNTDQKAFTVKQLSERWCCSEAYLYKAIKEGKLKAFPLSGTLKRISYNEVMRWENSGEKPNTDLMQSADTGSDGSGENSASPGTTTGSDAVSNLELERKRRRELSLRASRANKKN